MPDYAKAVRDAAQTLSAAIMAANDAGYHVAPSGLVRQLSVIAIGETAAVTDQSPPAAQSAKPVPDAPAGDTTAKAAKTG
jgi:hypothetical protein